MMILNWLYFRDGSTNHQPDVCCLLWEFGFTYTESHTIQLINQRDEFVHGVVQNFMVSSKLNEDVQGVDTVATDVIPTEMAMAG